MPSDPVGVTLPNPRRVAFELNLRQFLPVLSEANLRLAASMAALLIAPYWAAAAVPPPPMPRWFAEARDNIAKVKAVIGGDWVGRDAPLNPSVELRVGTFGDTAPSFLLVERTSLESYGQFHKLSVLFYSADCHAYEMLSVDKLSEPGAANAGDCRRSFPIESHPDGSLSFQYSDWNNERVQVVVDKVHWRETRDTPGITEKRDIEFVRRAKKADWGSVQ
jgi:hypothetical protein